MMGVKNTRVLPSPDVSHTLKQRPASVDAVGCIQTAFILLTAISCQFLQFHGPRLLIDREPKRIISASKMPIRTGQEHINLNLSKQEREAFIDTVYPPHRHTHTHQQQQLLLIFLNPVSILCQLQFEKLQV